MKNPARRESFLAGDVGATKTYLGLFSCTGSRPTLEAMETFPSSGTDSLVDMVAKFVSTRDASVSLACFGVPGPVFDGKCSTTNLPWELSESELVSFFKWDRCRLINDLEATARAIPILRNSELFALNKGKPTPNGTVGVFAPGTGLGISFLLFHDGKPYPLASEGGHVNFAPSDARTVDLLTYLLTKMPSVSLERVASGPGLFTIYSWLKDSGWHSEHPETAARIDDGDGAAAIADAASQGEDPLCVETMDIFTSVLGSAAGDFALASLATGGMYLGGGISPKILWKLSDGSFMKAFAKKGRFREFVSSIPVHVITNDRAALLGAAMAAHDMD